MIAQLVNVHKTKKQRPSKPDDFNPYTPSGRLKKSSESKPAIPFSKAIAGYLKTRKG